MKRVARALVLLLQLAPAAVRAATDGAEPGSPWGFAAYVDLYLQKGETALLIPTIFADRGRLHLEARYNYEDLDTASVWAGWTFTFGGEERFVKLTPMLGGVAGLVDGVAPGLEIEASWGRVAYWLESEYFFDLEDSSSNFLSTWSELNFYALPWLWFGASVQRLKAVGTGTEVDFGPMVGFGKPEAPGWSLSFYAYGLAEPDPLFLLTGALMF